VQPPLGHPSLFRGAVGKKRKEKKGKQSKQKEKRIKNIETAAQSK
jgi:hypothetical protein